MKRIIFISSVVRLSLISRKSTASVHSTNETKENVLKKKIRSFKQVQPKICLQKLTNPSLSPPSDYMLMYTFTVNTSDLSSWKLSENWTRSVVILWPFTGIGVIKGGVGQTEKRVLSLSLSLLLLLLLLPFIQVAFLVYTIGCEVLPTTKRKG